MKDPNRIVDGERYTLGRFTDEAVNETSKSVKRLKGREWIIWRKHGKRAVLVADALTEEAARAVFDVLEGRSDIVDIHGVDTPITDRVESQSAWERVHHSLRVVPAEAKYHLAYFTCDYKRVVEGKDGIGWETRAGKPVYTRDLLFSADGPSRVLAQAQLAAEIIPELIQALTNAEVHLGGPPED